MSGPGNAAPYSTEAPSPPVAQAPVSSTPQLPYPLSGPPQQQAHDYGYPMPQTPAVSHPGYQYPAAGQYPASEPTGTWTGDSYHVSSAVGPTGGSNDDSQHDSMWRRVTLGTAAILLVISSVATTLFITREDGSDTDSAVTVAPGPAGTTTDIDNRGSDSEPLTADEVFPTKALQLGRVRYEVLAKEVETRCPEAVSGNAATKLRSLDCTQLVRAAISDPDRTFLITAGILNLTSADDVDALADVLRGEGGGNFDMIVPTNMTVDAARARPLHFSRNGHYLTFTTGVPIKSTEGENIFDNDKLAQALDITRVLTADALERRQLGAPVS